MSSSESAAKSKRPALTAFKQQQLRAWQPILTPLPVIISFLVIGAIFIPVGVALLLASNSVVEVTYRYDNLEECKDLNSTCSISINVPEKMEHPVYVYYRLDNYYQNHRRYVKSRNDAQLRGDKITKYSDLSDCDPIKSEGGSKNASQFFVPCGLIAWSLFNDTFELQKDNNTVPWHKDGIAWKSDVEKKFKNPPADTPGIRIANITDEDFIVWMRTAGLPNFKKLYRIIDQDLEPGVYRVNIENNYPVKSFDGKKYVVLSTTSWIGGKNPFLGWAYIVVGIVCFVQGVAFGIKHKVSPRKLGDTKYLDWNK